MAVSAAQDFKVKYTYFEVAVCVLSSLPLRERQLELNHTAEGTAALARGGGANVSCTAFPSKTIYDKKIPSTL